jgi:hypothetical protein
MIINKTKYLQMFDGKLFLSKIIVYNNSNGGMNMHDLKMGKDKVGNIFYILNVTN